MKFPASIEIIPGLRILPESDTYAIRPESRSGSFCYFNSNGMVEEHAFHLVNTLGKPELMKVFNVSLLNLLVIERLHQSTAMGTTRVFSINWTPSTGFGMLLQ